MSKLHDAIVIGGSIAGLSASLTLSRSLLSVVCIDSGRPCNLPVQHSHNLLTHDGADPARIRELARADVEKYGTRIIPGVVSGLEKCDDGAFCVKTEADQVYRGKSLVLASGVFDDVGGLGIDGLEQFWGNSVFSCPYCHGYEYQGMRAGLLLSSPLVAGMPALIRNWNKDLTVFTTPELCKMLDLVQFEKNGVKMCTERLVSAQGDGVDLKSVTLESGEKIELDVLYAYPPVQINLKEQIVGLGIELTGPLDLIKVDEMQKTSVEGVYAAGDCTRLQRSLAAASAGGQMAASAIAHHYAVEQWNKL